MKDYVYNGRKLISDDSSLSAFAESLYGMMPTDYEGEDSKDYVMEKVMDCLENELPKTGIDYEELLVRYKDELGDLIYRVWDKDNYLSNPEFLGEGAQRYFNDVVYNYIDVHYEEFSDGGQNIRPVENHHANNWDYENGPAQIRAFFTTWCFEYGIEADTKACDDALNKMYWRADLEEQIPFEEFQSFMIKLIL